MRNTWLPHQNSLLQPFIGTAGWQQKNYQSNTAGTQHASVRRSGHMVGTQEESLGSTSLKRYGMRPIVIWGDKNFFTNRDHPKIWGSNVHILKWWLVFKMSYGCVLRTKSVVRSDEQTKTCHGKNSTHLVCVTLQCKAEYCFVLNPFPINILIWVIQISNHNSN